MISVINDGLSIEKNSMQAIFCVSVIPQPKTLKRDSMNCVFFLSCIKRLITITEKLERYL